MKSVQTFLTFHVRKCIPSQTWQISFTALTQLVGWQEGHPACKKLSIGLWMVRIWLELNVSYSSSSQHHLHQSLAPIKSRMKTFRYRLIQVVLKKWLYTDSLSKNIVSQTWPITFSNSVSFSLHWLLPITIYLWLTVHCKYNHFFLFLFYSI